MNARFWLSSWRVALIAAMLAVLAYGSGMSLAVQNETEKPDQETADQKEDASDQEKQDADQDQTKEDAATDSDDSAAEERRGRREEQRRERRDDRAEDRADEREERAEERGDRQERRQQRPDRGFGISLSDDGKQIKVDRVDRQGLLGRAGLREGDVLLSLDGRPIRSQDEFRQWFDRRGDERLPLAILREGVERLIYLDPSRYEARRVAQDGAGGAYLGVVFDQRIPGHAVIARVQKGSPAEQAGLQPGDALVSINDRPVRSSWEATAIIRRMEPGTSVEIGYDRRDMVEVTLDRRSTPQDRPQQQEDRPVLEPEQADPSDNQ